MANTKISALPAGAPAQSTDLLPIARAGANASLQVSDVLANAAPLASPSFTGQVTGAINAMGNVSGSITIDLSKGNVITMTLTGNVTVFILECCCIGRSRSDIHYHPRWYRVPNFCMAERCGSLWNRSLSSNITRSGICLKSSHRRLGECELRG